MARSILLVSGKAGHRTPHPTCAAYPLLILALALLALVGCAKPAPKETLGIKGGETVMYDSGDGQKITARYYSLSDDSLHFVKLVLPDGSQYTLPSIAAASGVRYTDDMSLVWWTKGDTAFAEKRDDTGEWKSLYPDCKEIPAK